MLEHIPEPAPSDRVAHGACVAFRANHLHPRRERDPIGDGMGA